MEAENICLLGWVNVLEVSMGGGGGSGCGGLRRGPVTAVVAAVAGCVTGTPLHATLTGPGATCSTTFTPPTDSSP